jgi:hypothetical protein
MGINVIYIEIISKLTKLSQVLYHVDDFIVTTMGIQKQGHIKKYRSCFMLVFRSLFWDVLFVGIVTTSIFKSDWLNGIVALIFLGFLFIGVARDIDNGRHTKSAVDYVQSERDSDTRIILYPKFKILGYAYYFNRDRFKNYDQEYGFYKVVEGFKEENFYAINQYSEARIDSSCQKLIFMMTDAGPKDQLLADFSQEFELEKTEHFPAIIDVYSFKRK